MNSFERPARPVCLTIAGLDPSGGAGILADIKAFAAFTCFGMAAVSSITFQNTTGVFGAEHCTSDNLRRQLVPIYDDFEVAAVKTGMLPTAELIAVTAEYAASGRVPFLVVDPVVRSTSGFDLIDDAALEVLVAELFPASTLVTPNIAEAERIAGFEIRCEDDIDRAGRSIQGLGAKSVLIKGGHFARGEATDQDNRYAIDRLYYPDGKLEFSGQYFETSATHGTGCVLSAAITANLALGLELSRAIGVAKEFVAEAIRSSPMLGKGNSPINI